MRLHRALIATAVTVGSLAGALALSDPARTETPATATPLANTTAAIRTETAMAQTAMAERSERSATSETPTAPSVPLDVPDGAEKFDTGLAPVGDDTRIVVGPAAAALLAQASQSIRQDIADNLDTTADELTDQFLADPAAFLSADGMAGYIEPALRAPADDTSATQAATFGEAPG